MQKELRKYVSERDPELFETLSRMYMYIVPDFHRQECFKLLKNVCDIIKEHSIIYCADRATLLGAVRHGGMLLFETCNNLIVNEDHWETLISLKPHFDKLGFVNINKQERYMNIVNMDRALKTDESFNFRMVLGPPEVKIICYRLEGRRIRPAKKLQEYFPIFNKSIIFPLKELQFNNHCEEHDSIMIPVPFDSEKVLDIEFKGWKNWFTIRPRMAADFYLHKTNAPFVPIRYYPDINDELFKQCLHEAVEKINNYKMPESN